MTRVPLSRIGGLFLRTGNLTFGGGDPTMAVLYTEMVTARRWLAAETYALVYALARVTPGTNLLAFCAGTAWELRGWPGAVVAVLAVTLPSTVAVVLLTAGYQSFTANRLAMAAINGTLAAAVGMMATGAWQLVRPHLTRARWVRAAVLAGGSALLSMKVPPIPVIGLAALVGFFWRAPEGR
jgi:chromate transporter